VSAFHSRDYDVLRQVLLRARLKGGLTQNLVATRLDKPQSYVSKYENGERRLDVIEFIRVCRAIGCSPSEELIEVVKQARL